ncbi:MAG: sugar phosphate nucleotidyltransferase [Actinobacteria bacterium]|nr:sugar phosphate nucleotidyltransferase [Actinomycetota bacterium]
MKKFENILILAGGDSTRFWPLRKKSYKMLFGKTLIDHLINAVNKYTEKLTIIVNKSDLAYFKNKINDTKIIAQKENLNGQAGAILSAKNYIFGSTLVLNAEDIFDYGVLNQYLQLIAKANYDCILLAKKVDHYFPGGYLKIAKNKVVNIIEKPDPKNVPSNFVRLVVDYFKDFQFLIKNIEESKASDDHRYEAGINSYLQKQNNTTFLNYVNRWYPLKYPWHLLNIMHYFLEKTDNQIEIGKNVKIAKTAKVVGPCYIGDNTVIGDFTMVRESHIGNNCLIGGYSEVTRSYLGNRVWLHRNYVGDSILDNNVQMGADAVIANFRFDEKTVKSKLNNEKIDTGLTKFGAVIGSNTKIGVNSTLLPGIKIGSNTFVAPGYTISTDVDDNMFIYHRKTIKNKLEKK